MIYGSLILHWVQMASGYGWAEAAQSAAIVATVAKPESRVSWERQPPLKSPEHETLP